MKRRQLALDERRPDEEEALLGGRNTRFNYDGLMQNFTTGLSGLPPMPVFCSHR